MSGGHKPKGALPPPYPQGGFAGVTNGRRASDELHAAAAPDPLVYIYSAHHSNHAKRVALRAQRASAARSRRGQSSAEAQAALPELRSSEWD